MSMIAWGAVYRRGSLEETGAYTRSRKDCLDMDPAGDFQIPQSLSTRFRLALSLMTLTRDEEIDCSREQDVLLAL